MTTTAPPPPLPASELLQLIEGLDGTCDGELQAVARLAASVLGAPLATVEAIDPADGRTHRLAAAGGPLGASRRYAGAPLRVGGVEVGALDVHDVDLRCATEEQQAALDDLALLAAGVLERWAQARTAARLAAEGEQARQELEWTVGALGAAHAELSTAQAFTDALLEVLPVGVVAVDAQGRRVLVNGVTRRWHEEAEGGTATVSTAPTGTFLRPDGVTPMAREELPLVRSLTGSRIAS